MWDDSIMYYLDFTVERKREINEVIFLSPKRQKGYLDRKSLGADNNFGNYMKCSVFLLLCFRLQSVYDNILIDIRKVGTI